MKRYSFIILIGLLISAVSCQKEQTSVTDAAAEQEFVPGGELVEVTFSADIEETKATLSGKVVSFVVGDHIGLYDGYALRDFTVTNVNSGTAWFTGKVRSGSNPKAYYAVYPYSAASQTLPTAEGAISIVFPNVQKLTSASSNSIAPEGLIAVAQANASGTGFSFKQASSLMKIKIPSADIKSVTLITKGSEILGGEMTCVPGSDPVAKSSSAVNMITLLPAGSTFTNSYEYYISLPPTTLSSGFILRFRKDTQYADVTTANSAVFPRKGGLNYVTALSSYSYSWTSGAPSLNITNQSTLQNFINSNLAGDIGTLANNINLTSWTPNVLRGHLNGNGKTISGLSVSKASPACFITTLEPGAKLSNVTFEGSITLTGSTANSKAGIVAISKGIIEGVTNKAEVITSGFTGAAADIGGLVGLLTNGGTIINSSNQGLIYLTGGGAASFIGGLVGTMGESTGGGITGTVVSCSNSGRVVCSSAQGQGLGGIAGRMMGGGIYSSTNTGSLEMSNCVGNNSGLGGIAGYVQNPSSSDLEIFACTNDVAISLSTALNLGAVGGIAGFMHHWNVSPYVIKNCENKKAITKNSTGYSANYGGAGGIVGTWRGSGTVEGNINRGSINLTHQHPSNGAAGIIGCVARWVNTYPFGLISKANYNFGAMTLTWVGSGSQAQADRGVAGGIIGYIEDEFAASSSITMTADRSVGDLTATGARVGGMFATASSTSINLSITLTNCKISGTYSDYKETTTITGSNYSSNIYSYCKTDSGYVTLSQSGSGYITAAQANAELAGQ